MLDMSIKSILCVTDLATMSRNAEAVALRLAQTLGAKLSVLSCGEPIPEAAHASFADQFPVIPPEYGGPEEDYLKYRDKRLKEAELHFSHLLPSVQGISLQDIEFLAEPTDEVTAAADIVRLRKFDLIIVGKQQTNFWERIFFGFPARELLEETNISTLFMPTEEKWLSWFPSEMVVSTALTGNEESFYHFCQSLASNLKCALTLYHVIDSGNLHFDLGLPQIIPIEYPSARNGQAISQTMETVRQERTALIQEVAKKITDSDPTLQVTSLVEFGVIEPQILEFVRNRGPGILLTIGAGEMGNPLKSFFLPGEAEALEEESDVPLLVVQKI